MSLFDWLLVGHLVGDFLLQSDGVARHKGQRWSWMLRHVAIYMIVMTVILTSQALSHPMSFWWLVAVWLFFMSTHILLDQRGFTSWWMRLIGISPNHPWMPIIVDQVFHVLTLAIAAHVLVTVRG
jgi:hypothetical protein